MELKMWKCQDGTVIEIKHLTDKHLENAIVYCKNKLDNLEYKPYWESLEKSLYFLKEEQQKRKDGKIERECPWCGHKMKMKYYEYNDPYPDVGINFPEKWKNLYCAKCKATGPKLEVKK